MCPTLGSSCRRVLLSVLALATPAPPLVAEDSAPLPLTEKHWQVLTADEFAAAGKVEFQDDVLRLERGQPGTGVRFRDPFPRSEYELTLEAKRVAGGDFFCGLTFPVGNGEVSLIMGGWGGWVVGLSCIDGNYAIDNNTALGIQFKLDQWYQVKVQVTASQILVWVDNENIIEVDREGHEFTASEEMQPCKPLGLATWKTTGAIRKIRWRKLGEA